MSSKRREYKVDDRAKKAAILFRACEANPDTRLSIPAAMRAKGYSDVEAADRILVQQVRRESQKKTPKDTPCPESAAALSLLALSTTANVGGGSTRDNNSSSGGCLHLAGSRGGRSSIAAQEDTKNVAS
jgi:hypothetical protein